MKFEMLGFDLPYYMYKYKSSSHFANFTMKHLKLIFQS